MKGKILFVAGAAVGYVLGARAGRGAYIKIKDRAGDLWENPSVQKTVHQAEDFVKDNAPVVGGKLKDVASDAASAAQSTVKSATKKADKASSTVKAKGEELAGKASDKASDATSIEDLEGLVRRRRRRGEGRHRRPRQRHLEAPGSERR